MLLIVSISMTFAMGIILTVSITFPMSNTMIIRVMHTPATQYLIPNIITISIPMTRNNTSHHSDHDHDIEFDSITF